MYQLNANHAPRASVIQVIHSAHTLSTFRWIRANHNIIIIIIIIIIIVILYYIISLLHTFLYKIVSWFVELFFSFFLFNQNTIYCKI